MKNKLHIVDVFAEKKYQGNQLEVIYAFFKSLASCNKVIVEVGGKVIMVARAELI